MVADRTRKKNAVLRASHVKHFRETCLLVPQSAHRRLQCCVFQLTGVGRVFRVVWLAQNGACTCGSRFPFLNDSYLSGCFHPKKNSPRRAGSRTLSLSLGFTSCLGVHSTLFLLQRFDLSTAAAPEAGFSSCLSRDQKCFSRFFCECVVPHIVWSVALWVTSSTQLVPLQRRCCVLLEVRCSA